MASKPPLPLLLAVLAATSALVIWDHWPGKAASTAAVIGAVERPTAAGKAGAPPRRAAAPDKGAAGPVPDLLPRDAFEQGAAKGDLFDTPAPPPPPPPMVAEPPPKPTAPPLPFTLLGRKLEEGRWEVYLAKMDQTYIVHVDDVIEGTYRVAEIRPPVMTLVHIPTDERQHLQIGGNDQ